MELIISLALLIVIIAIIRKKVDIENNQPKKVIKKNNSILKFYIASLIFIIGYYVFCYSQVFLKITFDFYIIPRFNSIMQILTIIILVAIPLIYIIIDFYSINISIILKVISILGISIIYMVLSFILLLLLWGFNPTTIFFYRKCEYLENKIIITEYPDENSYSVNHYISTSPFTMKYIRSEHFSYEEYN